MFDGNEDAWIVQRDDWLEFMSLFRLRDVVTAPVFDSNLGVSAADIVSHEGRVKLAFLREKLIYLGADPDQ